MIDPPTGSHAIVNDSLAVVIAGCSKALDGQVTDRHVTRLLSEVIEVLARTINDVARRSEERVTVFGDDLAELAGSESMLAWREPVCHMRLHGPVMGENSAVVIAGRDNDR